MADDTSGVVRKPAVGGGENPRINGAHRKVGTGLAVESMVATSAGWQTPVNAASRRRRWPKASIDRGLPASHNRPPRSVAAHGVGSDCGLQCEGATNCAPFMRGFSPPLTTLSLLAGIDLLTGQVHACVEERHRSREFVGFLKLLDAAYPADTAIKVLLDNHSAHVSKETNKWLAAQPDGRFSFVFTPKHGSWLNLIEGFFSKMARSMLRHIRVGSKAELKQRILAYLDDINHNPVVHKWTYRVAVPE
jgi:transposase